jgi:hypothetical protein
MRVFLLITFCFVFSVGSPTVRAQTQNDGRLKGLKKIYLLIETLDKTAEGCGLSEDLIRTAVMYPLSSSPMEIEDRSTTFYVNLGTLRSQGTCFSTLSIKIYQNVKLTFANFERNYKLGLWNKTWFGFSPPHEHGQMVRAAIETMTKDFLTAWNLDNKQ